MTGIQTFIISSGRPMNVPKMNAFLGTMQAMWCVPADEVGDYKRAGAQFCAPTGSLMGSRNWAIETAQADGAHCLQLSDDLKTLRFTEGKDNKLRRNITLTWAMHYMKAAMEKEKVQLAGVAPTDNAFFYNQPTSSKLFIVGDMILIGATSTPRFDEGLTLKEDYDFTCQHLAAYGAVVRCNGILASFQHRTNRGGAVADRSPTREQENIAYLKRKWPGHIFDNPRRDNEVLLKWK